MRYRVRLFEIMERAAKRLNRLVHDLLSLSQVEAREPIRLSKVLDVSRSLQETIATLAAVAETRVLA